MFADFNNLLAATLLFVLGHLLLSSLSVRKPLIQRFGEKGFRSIYSLVVAVAFVWMLLSYRSAPYLPVWEPPSWTLPLAMIAMVPAVLLFVIGLATPSPTAVGGERRLDVQDARPPAHGILSVTRHPFLCGVALFALAHLLANGDLATIVLMAGLLLLSLAGMAHIDARRAKVLGPLWGPIALSTSRVPFLAILQGRAALDLAGIGWLRFLAAAAVYLALVLLHPLLIGVPLVP